MNYSELTFDDPNYKSTPPHLRRDQIVSKLKESFDFENAHLLAAPIPVVFVRSRRSIEAIITKSGN